MNTALTLEQQEERDNIIIECMALGYIINRQTEYCVFVDFSGHVDSLSIEIAESKGSYNNKLCSTNFNIRGKWEDVDIHAPNGWLKMKLEMLRTIARSHEVPLESMEREVEHIYHHYF